VVEDDESLFAGASLFDESPDEDDPESLEDEPESPDDEPDSPPSFFAAALPFLP
jgi:hypothetical protein